MVLVLAANLAMLLYASPGNGGGATSSARPREGGRYYLYGSYLLDKETGRMWRRTPLPGSRRGYWLEETVEGVSQPGPLPGEVKDAFDNAGSPVPMGQRPSSPTNPFAEAIRRKKENERAGRRPSARKTAPPPFLIRRPGGAPPPAGNAGSTK
jgi:hypothetical protein